MNSASGLSLGFGRFGLGTIQSFSFWRYLKLGFELFGVRLCDRSFDFTIFAFRVRASELRVSLGLWVSRCAVKTESEAGFCKRIRLRAA